ncbi:SHOCT domain-containing protein [Clostridium sp. D2Q-11]|uniref:SHOCT domain-containing protein n=1 Tax=Anaeromonas frigoriresistens TaxID=2683708 RepID=A0A942UTD9_9FIRM|nr:SHOCT domain-containing protein [Anaeromonas frigoriresistens]MBS4538889.1 SHOCT domain-containing protein [Anaeromonas frigoriresistens]
MMHRGFGMMGGGGFLGFIIIALIVYFAFKYINNNGEHTSNFNKRNDALDVLNERYAKGEISDEEYNRKKDMLRD